MAVPASAQSTLTLPRTSPFAGGIPAGAATPAPISLTIIHAVQRALDHNLGLLLAEQSTASATAERINALSQLLPSVREIGRAHV